MADRKHRILVMSHAHPDFSLGGGEIAAYNLFKAYRQHPRTEKVWFLARADRGRGATGQISQRRENEFLWEQSVNDWHRIKAAHQDSLTTWLTDLIRGLRPTVIHTHHYAHLGLEYLRIIKQIDPTIQIIMTLHEYMAICRHNGQMIKVGSQNLCTSATPDECHQCFPKQSAEDFWLREHFIKSYFSLVDHFVSPSEFLRQRYIQWGVAAEKIVMIENGQADELPLAPRTLADGETRYRFGYFGQINPFKGLTVLLEALRAMPEADRHKVVLEVHGANLELQTSEMQQKVKTLVDPLLEKGVVRWVGPYRPEDLSSRMAHVDWVVIPSIWWENSPMVIQEAFVHGRPVIGSDIGGMKEKISHGINGLHVPVGNTLLWAETFAKVSKYTTQWDKLREGIQRPASHEECANAHMAYFRKNSSTEGR
jgi:glycosyltransferase involved in cell wall biosynthesis